jgi:hypothetical protein
MDKYVTRQHISFITATAQIIFGIRVGFTDNPIKCQNAPSKRQILKDNHVEVTQAAQVVNRLSLGIFY